MTGHFITFEGGEGAGKSTQVKRLNDHLIKAGYDTLLTREPGGSEGAEALREFLLFGGHSLSLRSEIMAHFAARCDHIDQVIKPALEKGKIVICDRYTDSTLAYQGYGLGKGDQTILSFIQKLILLIDLQPEQTFIFTIPYAIAQQRIQQRSQKTDRYEQQNEDFHHRVADGFIQIAKDHPSRCHIINGHDKMETIEQIIFNKVHQQFPDIIL